MLLEGCLVAGATGIDDLDLPLADIGIVPVRLYTDNLLVQLGANVPRRADDHALTENADELAHLRRTGFPVLHDVLAEHAEPVRRPVQRVHHGNRLLDPLGWGSTLPA